MKVRQMKSSLLLLETVARMRIARNSCTENTDAKEILLGFTHAKVSLEVENTRTRTNKFTPLFFDGRNFVRLPNYLEQT